MKYSLVGLYKPKPKNTENTSIFFFQRLNKKNKKTLNLSSMRNNTWHRAIVNVNKNRCKHFNFIYMKGRSGIACYDILMRPLLKYRPGRRADAL